MKTMERVWMKLLVGVLLLLVSGVEVLGEKAPPTRPNIVLIISDDQGYADFSPSVVKDVRTPNMERLAKSGIKFSQAYVAAPICNASRIALMTGIYPQRLGTYWYNSEGIQDAVTLAEVLKEQGYANGYVGKVHYGKGDVPSHRDFPLNHGFDYFYGCFGGHKHYLIHDDDAEKKFQTKVRKYDRGKGTLAMGSMWENEKKVDEQGFSTELFGQKARAFIDQNRNSPFFLQLSFNAVHAFTHQLPESYLTEKGIKGYRDWDPAKETMKEWNPGYHPEADLGRALMLGQLQFMDQEIGKLIDHLQQLGLLENTLIVFLSDNGGSNTIFADNTPLRGGKYTLFEGGVRVPMVISWPGVVPQGKTMNNIVSALDLFPTFTALAGGQYTGKLDGIDLSPLLLGKNQALEHEALFWDTDGGIAVRQGDWKLRVEHAPKGFKSPLVDNRKGEFLFNLKDDIGETTNLKESEPRKYEELLSLHKAWKSHLDAEKNSIWKLVWSEEFDYEGTPDPLKWDFEEGFIRNEEPQYYTRARKENARVSNGILTIEARKERFSNAYYRPESDNYREQREFGEYTSASLITLGRADWTYGRIEVRAKVPAGSGVWPAIWTMGADRLPPLAPPEEGKVPWPYCGEIDIMEFIGKEPYSVHGAVHFPGPEAGQHKSMAGPIKVEDPAYNDFHVYAAERYPDRIDFYYDDQLRFTFPLDRAGKGSDNPFRKPHYLLLNLALGGWGGEIDESLLPQQFLVDYVRVYEKKDTQTK